MSNMDNIPADEREVICEHCGVLNVADDVGALCQPSYETRRKVTRDNHAKKTGHTVRLFPEDYEYGEEANDD